MCVSKRRACTWCRPIIRPALRHTAFPADDRLRTVALSCQHSRFFYVRSASPRAPGSLGDLGRLAVERPADKRVLDASLFAALVVSLTGRFTTVVENELLLRARVDGKLRCRRQLLRLVDDEYNRD